jgi:P27 family predicted phage terminase small subunit
MVMPAKPVVLQLLEGNKGKYSKKQLEERLERENSIKPKTDNIKPPSWLSPFAKKFFKKRARELLEVDLMTNVDVEALARLAHAYDMYVRCSQEVENEGLMVEYTNKAAETNKVPHPLLTKMKAFDDQMKYLESQFGLTPAARAKLAIHKEPEKEKTEEEVLFGDV